MIVSRVSQLYMTGAVFSLDGSDSIKETMQTSLVMDTQVSASGQLHTVLTNTIAKSLALGCTVPLIVFGKVELPQLKTQL